VFAWSEEEVAIRDAVRSFVDKEVRPLQDDLEHGELPPYEVIRKFYATFGLAELAADAFDRSILRDAAAPGSAGRVGAVGAAGDDSGSGGGAVAHDPAMPVIVSSEFCRVSMGIPAAIGVSVGLAGGTINSRGTVEQRQRWARDLLTFAKVGAWAITEPDAGSDAFGGMRTTVRRDGDEWVLNGQKTFITNGPYADTIVVYAKHDDGSGLDRRDQPVLTFVLDSGMDGLEQSRPLRKMGMHSSPTGQLFFDDVRLGADRLLGSPTDGGGRESARENFVVERVGIAALALGVIEESLRLCVDYARSRELWGQPIGDFQLIQLKLAEMEIARVNVRNMVFSTIEQRRAGVLPSLAEASAIKLYASRAATDVAMEAVQLFGGNGYMAEYRVEQLARDAKSLMIYAGSNEVQVTHVAKALLRGP
jgi:alkylation response protein AidB-like acyl-CoA dehydrogenase